MFDSHAHLSSPEILPCIDAVMERACRMNILNICTDKASLEAGIEIAKKYPQIVNAGATTPHDVAQEGMTMFPLFAKAAQDKHLVAIGETGLDYHYKHSDIALQKTFLLRYLDLASSCHLPVIFHCRDAFQDLFAMADCKEAILHCFTGTLAEAEEVLRRGWYLSLSGIVTFKKSDALREVAKMVPLEQLLIETDSPYLAPQSKRGKQNEPSFLMETAECIAKVRQISVEQVVAATTKNACKILKINNL
jgi:TatD DNase family protein